MTYIRVMAPTRVLVVMRCVSMRNMTHTGMYDTCVTQVKIDISIEKILTCLSVTCVNMSVRDVVMLVGHFYGFLCVYSCSCEGTYREVGGWGRDPKKSTGRNWGMGSSTI